MIQAGIRMNRIDSIKSIAENQFEVFLKALESGKDKEWQWLVQHLWEVAIPWIRKIDGNLPKQAVVSEAYFIEEVFAESLIKFYEKFKTGRFNSLADLRGLLFRIAELKLKEGYRSVKKDQMIFFPEFTQPILEDIPLDVDAEDIERQRTIVKEIEAQLAQMPKEEREILLRYAKGEKLKQISKDLNLKEETGRKKKQRALQKLRKKLYKRF